jgi:hypothetical protein
VDSAVSQSRIEADAEHNDTFVRDLGRARRQPGVIAVVDLDRSDATKDVRAEHALREARREEADLLEGPGLGRRGFAQDSDPCGVRAGRGTESQMWKSTNIWSAVPAIAEIGASCPAGPGRYRGDSRVRCSAPRIDPAGKRLLLQALREGSMTTATENLARLTSRAREAEQKAADAARQTRTDLEKTVQASRESAEAEAAKLQASAEVAKDQLDDAWAQQQQAWNDHVALLRERIDQKKSEIDTVRAENRAEAAETDAMFAIDFAYSAIEEAEYATLQAVLARSEATDAAANSSGA